MKRCLAALSLVSTVVAIACGQPLSVSDTSKIIDQNDLIKVQANAENLPESLRPMVNAFGILELGCTVTHIGGGIALTAGHCISATVKRGPDAPCWDKMSIRWNFREGIENQPKSVCIRVLAAQYDSGRDYAVLAVDNAPEAKIEVDVSARPNADTRVTIFGHPMKRALEWSQYCTVQAAPQDFQGPDRFGHQCDTEPGNSGSTIIDASSLKVIGIHNGGKIPWNYATFVVGTPLVEAITEAMKSEAARAHPVQ